jgi:hypothetical protein
MPGIRLQRNRCVALVAALAFPLGASAALAGTLDQAQEDTSNCPRAVHLFQDTAQFFTAGLSGDLDQVDFNLWAFGIRRPSCGGADSDSHDDGRRRRPERHGACNRDGRTRDRLEHRPARPHSAGHRRTRSCSTPMETSRSGWEAPRTPTRRESVCQFLGNRLDGCCRLRPSLQNVCCGARGATDASSSARRAAGGGSRTRRSRTRASAWPT